MKTTQPLSASSTPFRKLLSLSAASVILAAASTAYGQSQTSETLYNTGQSDESAPIAESPIGGPSSADQTGNSQVQAEGLNQVEFDQLDRDSDQQLTEQELEDVSQFQDKNSQGLLGEYDQDNDQALSEQEYQQLQRNEVNNQQPQDQQSAIDNQPSLAQQAGESQNDPATASEGQEASDKPKIIVEQQPAKIVVEKPAPQVTIKQAKPKVRITTRDPEIEVEQGEPEVSVNQPEPRVSVDQREPEVEVREADPDVEVNRAEPEVQMRQAEPQVSFTGQEQQDEEAAGESQSNQTDRQTTAQSRTEEPANTQASSGALYSVSLERLREADVVDGDGKSIGDVAEVVVKQDGSEVGFIIAPSDRPETEANYVYTSADEVTLEGDQLVMDSLDNAASVSDTSEFQPGDFELAPRTEQSLDEVLQDPQFSQR